MLKLFFFSVFFFVNFYPVFCKVKSNCDAGGSNARKLNDVVQVFNQEVEELFVGQFRAVREVRREIENKISFLQSEDEEINSDEKPLLLHLVGPSGTGKSFLAQIIAKSFFKPQNCHSAKQYFGNDINFQAGSTFTSAALFAAQVGIMANPFAAAAAAVGGASLGLLGSVGIDSLMKHVCKDVDEWILTCGVAYVSFSESSEDEAATLFDVGVQKLAAELQTYKHSILVLDDFNFCVGKCQERLKGLLSQRSAVTANGDRVSAKGAMVILTSDLTQTGLEMERGENYLAALEKVEKASMDYWGQGSFVTTAASAIPFAPLSDGEIIKVVDKMLVKVERNLRLKVNTYLQKLEEMSDYKQLYRWTGRFVVAERTKLQIIDELHLQIEKKNSRAIVEQLSHMLLRLLSFPVPIGERISKSNFKLGVTKDEKEIFGIQLTPLTKTMPTTFFNQDITLVYSPEGDSNFLKLSIDDDVNGF